ncbi:MAG: hypothetical protein IJJ45_01365 [Clostridia bacterium]|nr:hypothetical protein [Clostridia bacterium]
MNSRFAAQVREAAQALLPVGAMLRRDRGDALFVTDAIRRAPGVDWPAAFEAAGFLCDCSEGPARLTPGALWHARLADSFPDPPNALCAALRRFDGPPDDVSLRLFARAVKALDSTAPDPDCERLLRQRAAAVLRTPGCPGGSLYACALAVHLMVTESEGDDLR